MTGGAEFDDRDPVPGEVDDILDLGHDEPRWYSRMMDPARRHPRGARAALWLASGLAIGIALVSGFQSATNQRAGRSPSSSTSELAAPPPTKQQAALASVLALTNHAGRLSDYLRQTSHKGACTLVPVGHSAPGTITKVIETALPGYVVTDVGRTIDQFAGLCSVELRATHRGDATLALSVASPPSATPVAAYTLLETGIVTRAGTTTKYVTAVTHTGWTILIGATGHAAELPSAQDLLQLAQDPSLIW